MRSISDLLIRLPLAVGRWPLAEVGKRRTANGKRQTEKTMSRRNGDKARDSLQRKRNILMRAKSRAKRDATKQPQPKAQRAPASR
jgi:hypothetical protein